MTPPLDLDRLEELAKAGVMEGEMPPQVRMYEDCDERYDYLEAVTPETILQLIAEIKRLRECLEGLARPCTRTDYSVADLDREVIFIARQALKGPHEPRS